MGFALSYLDKHCLFRPFITNDPEPGTSLIVVIPCFNEPDILKTVISLYNADRPSCPVEVIVVVNAPEGAGEELLGRNRRSIRQLGDWSSRYSSGSFMVHVADAPPFPRKHAGAGLARKSGMDEAVRRFSLMNNEKGVIVSLDADSVCDSNYFTSMEECFSVPGRTGCTIYFEHPAGDEMQLAFIKRAATEYELYMRYYVQAMRFAGFPWAFHTIGSCFAVNAKIYAVQGGMNRKKAGEDFYFLHKIFPLGNFTELNSTRVIPSSRVSDRVPFGTGTVIKRLAGGNQATLKTWPPASFEELSVLFGRIPELYRADETVITAILMQMPSCIRDFLIKAGFVNTVAQINQHTAGPEAFRKRFFLWFNAFRILKFLNYARGRCREDLPVTAAAATLLGRTGMPSGGNSSELLLKYRELQRNSVWKS